MSKLGRWQSNQTTASGYMLLKETQGTERNSLELRDYKSTKNQKNELQKINIGKTNLIKLTIQKNFGLLLENSKNRPKSL